MYPPEALLRSPTHRPIDIPQQQHYLCENALQPMPSNPCSSTNRQSNYLYPDSLLIYTTQGKQRKARFRVFFKILNEGERYDIILSSVHTLGDLISRLSSNEHCRVYLYGVLGHAFSLFFSSLSSLSISSLSPSPNKSIYKFVLQ